MGKLAANHNNERPQAFFMHNVRKRSRNILHINSLYISLRLCFSNGGGMMLKREICTAVATKNKIKNRREGIFKLKYLHDEKEL